MPTWQQRFLVACGGIIGYSIAYVVCDFAQWPRWTYLVLERRWILAESVGPLETNYLGIVLWGLSGGLLGAALVAVVTRFIKRELPAIWNNLAAAWALTAFAYAGLYYTWGLWPF